MAHPIPLRRRKSRVPLALFAMLGIAALLVAFAGGFVLREATSVARTASGDSLIGFTVLDGDTIDLGGTRIRLADIDAPELFSPQCTTERALAEQSRDRLAALLAEGPVTLAPYERDIDRYGRQLRIVTRDGRSLGATLVAEGLARAWDGKRHPWC